MTNTIDVKLRALMFAKDDATSHTEKLKLHGRGESKRGGAVRV